MAVHGRRRVDALRRAMVIVVSSRSLRRQRRLGGAASGGMGVLGMGRPRLPRSVLASYSLRTTPRSRRSAVPGR